MQGSTTFKVTRRGTFESEGDNFERVLGLEEGHPRVV